jgi:protein-disulfide isomerase
MRKSKERILFWLVVFILIGGSVFAIIHAMSSSQKAPLPSEFSDKDWIKGNPEAETTLIEYSDFQCPACVYYYELMEDVMAEFGSHMKFAYRHFPLKSIHPNATLAAQASEAAGIQGKFWEMYELLFKYQSDWSDLKTEKAEEEFIKYATGLDLNVKQFIDDLNSKKVKDEVEGEYQSATEAGLSGTPSFFLNGEKIRNPRGLEEFRTLIRQAIEQNNS